MTSGGPAEIPGGDADDAAREVFGDRFDLAVGYARLLAGDGVAHGHLGPREVPRLWSRHLVNCALVADLLPPGASVVDVGSGAGLPAIPLAIRRPDLTVTAVEPMLRRVVFLEHVVSALGLPNARVVRGRAEDATVSAQLGRAPWVTARAVAPLDRLVRWCLPLLGPGGRLLALKGRSASTEVHAAEREIVRCGGRVVGGAA